MQIVALSLTTGAAIALAIFAIIRAGGHAPPAPQLPLITYFAAAFTGIVLLGRLIVPDKVAAATIRRIVWQGQPGYSTHRVKMLRSEENRRAALVGVYQSRMILAMAPLEGVAFFLATTYFIEGQPLALGLGILLVFCQILHIPTRSRVERWVEIQEEKLQQEG